MVKGVTALVGLFSFVMSACAGSAPPPEPPPPPAAPASEVPVEAPPPPGPEASDETPENDGESTAKVKEPSPAEPEFTEGMSVDEAQKLIPRDAQRMNLDSDALGRPLMNQSLYEPCKLGQNQHFKLRVAIWNGKAVGIDVVTTPNNPKVAECVKQQIRGMTWKDKVPSLNTVEYAM